METPASLLVIGAVEGRFREVFEKITKLHKKNAFAFAIIVGNLFSDPSAETPEQAGDVDALLNGQIVVPFPVYFALSNHPLPDKIVQKLESSGEVCENLSFLGKRTIIKTSEGIRIVALGGILDPDLAVDASKDNYLPFFSEGDAKTLRGAHAADILVTGQWPSNIRSGSNVAFEPPEPTSHQAIADLCTALKPRYHFSTSPHDFFEREPFLQPSDDGGQGAVQVTRFISLATYGNAKKQKWIYAFKLDLSASSAVAVPLGTTQSPLVIRKKRPNPADNSYRFSNDNNHRRSNKRRKAPPPTPSECFFCLSNSNVAQHLITSIGNEAYLTTAKGPLSTADTFDDLNFPSHMLIIPLTHTPTLAFIEPQESRENVFHEMQRYRKCLNEMLKSLSPGKLGSVAWEVSRAGGIHTHWQYLPVPLDLIQKKLVEVAFQVEAENENFPMVKKREVGDGAQESTDFFRAIIWDPSETKENADGCETHLFLPIDPTFRFDLQFGRKVLGKLLGLEKRFQWQECGQSESEEKVDAEAFKAAFKRFDFSLDE